MNVLKQTIVNASADLEASQVGRGFRLRLADDYGSTAYFVGAPNDARMLREWLGQYLEVVREPLEGDDA